MAIAAVGSLVGVAPAFAGSGTTSTITQVSSTLDPAYYGEEIEIAGFVMTSTSAPVTVGTMTFTVGSTTFGPFSVDSNGIAVMTLSDLAVGCYSVVAVYNGTSTYSSSSSQSSSMLQCFVSNPTTTALSASRSTALYGQAVTFTATISTTTGTSSYPSGTVVFTDGTTVLGSSAVPSGSGTATFTTDALPLGSQSITASYGGDQGFEASTSPSVTEVVTRAPTTLSATPALLGLSPFDPYLFTVHATLTSQVSGAPLPGEPVAFSTGGTPLCTTTTDASGEASCSLLSANATGIAALVLADGYQVTYAGDADYLPSTTSAGLISY
ncbi:MAG: Ig-like domain-containing protein [Acidimicrobiales bacterium]